MAQAVIRLTPRRRPAITILVFLQPFVAGWHWLIESGLHHPMTASKRTLMCVPPVVMLVVDAALTLRGQVPDYWSGGYSFAREDNPIACWFLQLHPMSFVSGVILWTVLFMAAIHRLPIKLARVTAFGVMLGHALGAASWLWQWRFGPVFVFGLLLAARALDTLIWDSRDDPARPR